MLREVFPERRRCAWTEVFSAAIPTLVMVDLQREYVTEGRALHVPANEAAIVNCKKALSHARKIGIPVAFMRLSLKSSFFNTATDFSRWIDGVQPLGGDFVFEREKPSCYSSSAFCDVIERSGGNFVIAGFSGDGACLATVIDGFNRGHNITFLLDASASQPIADFREQSHKAVCGLISLYGHTVGTDEWILRTNSLGT